MDDRELLGLAAKALGLHMEFPDDDDGVFVIRVGSRSGRIWNPLVDDGDALRLAVKLGITIDTSDGVNVMYIINHVAHPIHVYEFDCVYAQTRRSIVRAAAEIGRAMQ